MINTSVSKNEHTIQSGVVDYPIGFPFYFNPDRTPQLLVKIGDEELRFNHNFELSEDNGSVVLRPTEEESWTLEGPEDFSWMTKWDGKDLLIERVVPFTQDSDYQLGRISSEQIERDFDLSVMRDQILLGKIAERTTDVSEELESLHSRIDFVQEEHRLDMAAVDEVMATKATKTELENAKTVLGEGIQGNADAIQKTRDDYIEADSEIHKTLNNHEGELATLHNDIDDLGDQVSDIESKIPESASETNQLVTKEDLKSIDLDDYVKKSGDTMTGDLVFDVVSRGDTIVFQDSYSSGSVIKRISSQHQTQGLILSETKNGTVDMQFTMIADGFFMPRGNRLLGSADYPWKNIYAKKLNNGADITIPTEGGTLARLEDVANKQDKLTAGDNITIVDNVISATGGGDFLPLSGGTITGKVAIDVGESPTTVGARRTLGFTGTVDGIAREHWFSYIPQSSSLDVNSLSFTNIGNIYPHGNGEKDIGSVVRKFNIVHANMLSSAVGTQILIPAKSGTVALTEDVADAVANIDALPDQTGNAGKVLTTDGSTASWQEPQGGGGIANVIHDSTLTGSGTNASPLGLAEAIKDEIADKAPKETVEALTTSVSDIMTNYLPKAGGVVTGNVSFEGGETRPKLITLKNTEYNESFSLGVNYVGQLAVFDKYGGQLLVIDSDGSIQANQSSATIGSTVAPWSNVYTKKLNNGADLSIPTEGGTLARIEDIDSALGDISTALTAILGE